MAAKREHNLDIDYVGLWNGMNGPEGYRNALREAVGNSSIGPRTTVLDRIEHYPGSYNEAHSNGCTEYSEEKLRPGELWADEEGSMFDGRSARCLARVLNRNYISMCKTATIQWHLISSFYDYLPWPRCGVAVANEPWSGNFEITSPTWAIAHTTQFANIGWKYAAHGAGVSMLARGGSMVTRVAPDMSDFSIVIEKMRSNTPICGHGANPPADVDGEVVVIQLKGTFLKLLKGGGKKLAVWHSNLASGSEYGVNPPESELFQNRGVRTVDTDGIIKLWVHPDEIYTLTTLTRGKKQVPWSPPKKAFPIPYKQSFNDERIAAPGRMWYDVMGAWEVQSSPYGDAAERGNVLRQVVPVYPNCWGYRCEPPASFFAPSTLKGDLTVQLDVRLEEDGDFILNAVGFNYSQLALKSTGTWSMGDPEYISGPVNFAKGNWHTVKLRMKPDGSQQAWVDGERLAAHASLLTSAREVKPERRTTSDERCDDNDFPVTTKGRKFIGLKPSGATSYEACRSSCCSDENLCDIFQFNGAQCEIGRDAEGFVKDTEGIWAGGKRGHQEGWHLKMSLSRYIYASVDNFQIFETPADEIAAEKEQELLWTIRKGNDKLLSKISS